MCIVWMCMQMYLNIGAVNLTSGLSGYIVARCYHSLINEWGVNQPTTL